MSADRQPMPVLNAMLQPGRTVWLPPERKGGPSRSARSQDFARRLIEVDQVRRVWAGAIPNVRNLLPEELVRKSRHRNRDEPWTDLGLEAVDSLGPQRLPFPALWIEFALDGQDSPLARVYGGYSPLAAYVVATDYGYGICFFGALPDGSISTPNLVEQVETEPDGSVRDIHAKWAVTDMEDDPIHDDDQIAMMHVTLPVMWAVGLMNCRNVHTVEVTPEPRRTKKQRRPRPAGVSYHTIVLPSVRSAGGSLDPAQGSLADQPLHKVRGHFKTYTADAPLLGRHTGTYWWGHQVRGSREHGEIVSDYRMTP